MSRNISMGVVSAMMIGTACLCPFVFSAAAQEKAPEPEEVEIVRGSVTNKPVAPTNEPAVEVRVWAKKTDQTAGKDQLRPEKKDAKVPENDDESTTAQYFDSEPAVTIKDLNTLAFALQKKQSELSEAKIQIADLKDTVKKMRETARKERLSLLNNLACAYESAGEYRKAEARFLEALELNPDDSDVIYNLAILYDEDIKDRKKARVYYEKFLSVSDDSADKETVKAWLDGLKRDRPSSGKRK